MFAFNHLKGKYQGNLMSFQNPNIFELRMKDQFFQAFFSQLLKLRVTARIFLLFDLSSAVQIYVSYIYIQLG